MTAGGRRGAGRVRGVCWFAIVAALGGWSCAGKRSDAAAAAAALERALEGIGTRAALERFGGVELRAVGTLDKSAEGQGFAPGRPSPGPYREALAFHPAADRVAWEYREERYDGTSEEFREAYPAPDRRLYVVADPSLAIPAVSERFAEDRRRLARRLPHLALDELLERPTDLSLEGSPDGGLHVQGLLADGTRLRVELEPRSHRPTRLSYTAPLSAKGDTEVAWWFDDYRPVEGLGALPFRYGSSVGGHAYTDMRVESAGAAGPALFEVPEGHRELPLRRLDDATVDEPPPLEFEEIAPGVHRVPEVRGGFAPLVVLFDDFSVVVDAPASFPLLGKIPAEETDPAPSFSDHSTRLLDSIAGEAPGQPVRYLVLTHAHEDHVGGVRAFVQAGATVLAAPQVRTVVEKLVGLPGSSVGDGLELGASLRFEVVEETRVIEAGGRRLELIPVPDNPHAEGMLVAHVPHAGILFVSDLVTPEPLEAYPRAAHAALDRFFAAWLDHSGLAVDRVYAMHGAPFASREHLTRALGEGG